MQKDYEIEVEWRAFELHPEIPPEGMQLPSHIRARFAETSERVKQMAREARLEMVTSEILPNSRRALEAAEYARQQGRHAAFHTAVFHRYYAEGKDIGQWAALREAAEEAGLDAEAMQCETEAGKYCAAVEAQIAEARRLGITGVPTYIFDGAYAIVGAQPYEAFQELMAQLADETARE